MKRSLASDRKRSAFSLVELIVTVAIIGLLAAISIPIYSKVYEASETAVARDHVEALNRAATEFSHACWKFPTEPDSSSTEDEYAVVRSLQYKFPASNLKVGSPFFEPTYDPQPSSNAQHLRIRWNGKSFQLLERGTPGTGLHYDSETNFRKTPYVFPSGYKPEGAA